MRTKGCPWQRVDGFLSMSDYLAAQASLRAQVQNGLVEERKVRKPYSGLQTLDERWYKCKANGEVWRLIAPDPPFPGIFEPI